MQRQRQDMLFCRGGMRKTRSGFLKIEYILITMIIKADYTDLKIYDCISGFNLCNHILKSVQSDLFFL